MSTWRKICEEIIEAGGKATKRPWRWEYGTDDRGQPYGGLIYTAGGVSMRRQIARIMRLVDVEGDTEYIVSAANNADRLARAYLALAKRYTGAVSAGRKGYAGKVLAKLWQQSADPEGGGDGDGI